MKRGTLLAASVLGVAGMVFAPGVIAITGGKHTAAKTAKASVTKTVAPLTKVTGKSKLYTEAAIVYFDVLSPKLTKSGKAVLNRLASARAEGYEFTVTGYVQVSPTHSNDASLSLARAKSVRAFLKGAGVVGKFKVQGLGIHPTAGMRPSARQAIIQWTEAPEPQPAPTQTPTPTPTATPTPKPTETPAAKTCTVVFNPSGGKMSDNSTLTIKSGDDVTLRSVLYGPGSFSGWFTGPFTAYDNSKIGLVGFAGQKVAVACDPGSTVTFYAHWEVSGNPTPSGVPTTIYVAVNNLDAGDVVNITCNGAPCGSQLSAGAAPANVNTTFTAYTAVGASLTVVVSISGVGGTTYYTLTSNTNTSCQPSATGTLPGTGTVSVSCAVTTPGAAGTQIVINGHITTPHSGPFVNVNARIHHGDSLVITGCGASPCAASSNPAQTSAPHNFSFSSQYLTGNQITFNITPGGNYEYTLTPSGGVSCTKTTWKTGSSTCTITGSTASFVLTFAGP